MSDERELCSSIMPVAIKFIIEALIIVNQQECFGASAFSGQCALLALLFVNSNPGNCRYCRTAVSLKPAAKGIRRALGCIHSRSGSLLGLSDSRDHSNRSIQSLQHMRH